MPMFRISQEQGYWGLLPTDEGRTGEEGTVLSNNADAGDILKKLLAKDKIEHLAARFLWFRTF